jgi:hypothetical protein
VSYSTTEVAALDAGGVNCALVMRLGVAPALQVWLGPGPLSVPPNSIDATQETYLGAGQLPNFPQFQQLVNGAAERLSLALSGVDDRILALASFANEVQGADCDFGFGLFDENWALIGGVHWQRHYVADYIAVTVTPAPDPSGQSSKTAALSIGSLMTGRRRRGLSFFTAQDQRERSPDDGFCDLTPRYSMAGQKQWPNYG